jgi:hypothetical protein
MRYQYRIYRWNEKQNRFWPAALSEFKVGTPADCRKQIKAAGSYKQTGSIQYGRDHYINCNGDIIMIVREETSPIRESHELREK